MSDVLLLTGAAGFIGRHMSRAFFDEGWRVVGVDVVPPENAPLASLGRYVSMKLPDSTFCDLLKEERPTATVHCAGRASVGLSFDDPSADFFSGPVVTFELLESLRRWSPRSRVVFLSSAAVYGQPESLPVNEELTPAPISPYGAHKLQCELLCREFAAVFGLETCSLRVFSAYGPGLRRQVIWDICYKLLTQRELLLQGDGSESRDFVHVRDVVQAAKTAIDHAPMSGETYNVACGEETTIRALAERIVSILGSEKKIAFDGVVPPGTPRRWKADLGRIRDLGFSPGVDLTSGLTGVAEWCRSEIADV